MTTFFIQQTKENWKYASFNFIQAVTNHSKPIFMKPKQRITFGNRNKLANLIVDTKDIFDARDKSCLMHIVQNNMQRL